MMIKRMAPVIKLKTVQDIMYEINNLEKTYSYYANIKMFKTKYMMHTSTLINNGYLSQNITFTLIT